MKKNYSLIAAVICASMLITGVAVPVQAFQSKGDSTLQLAGSFFHAQNTDVGTVNIDVGYGYYLTESWELGILQTVGYSFVDDGDDVWSASTIPYFNYNFRTQESFQPFIGAFIGASYNKDDATGTMGPQLGFRSYVNDSTYIVAKYRYEWFFSELNYDEIEDNSSDGNHVISLGVGFNF